MLIRIANRQSDLGLQCLSRPFFHATSVLNFRIFTVLIISFTGALCVPSNGGLLPSLYKL